MDLTTIENFSSRILEKRAGIGIRVAAKEIGISPATLSRVENKKIPDLDTFGKICRWLGDDPAIYLGMPSARNPTPLAQVHFKKGTAIKSDSAQALARMIMLVQKTLLEQDEA